MALIRIRPGRGFWAPPLRYGVIQQSPHSYLTKPKRQHNPNSLQRRFYNHTISSINPINSNQHSPPFLSYAAFSLEPRAQQQCRQQRPRPRTSSTTTVLVSYHNRLDFMRGARKCMGSANDCSLAVFSKSYCPYCKATKQLLTSMGAQFHAIELDQVGTFMNSITSLM